MNKKIAATMVALLTLGMVGTATAQLEDQNSLDSAGTADEQLNEGADINVGISSTTQIDVKPKSLNFNGLSVGTQTTEENTGTNTFGSFSIENIGSEYIDTVWASASHSNSDPFGTGISDNYDAGNFLQIKPANTSRAGVNGDDSVYHYVNRYEFANSWTNSSSEIPTYIEADPSNVGTTPSDTFVGRIQAGDEWYFYTIVPSSGTATCDGDSGAVLRIGDSVHSSSSFGTVDFTSSGSDYSEYSLQTTNGDYGLTQNSISLDFQVNGSPVTRTYDFLTRCSVDEGGIEQSDPHVIRTRYNVQAGDVGDLTATPTNGGTNDNIASQTQFLLNPSTDGDMLLPGEHLPVDAAIEVPQGVPQGDVNQGTLTLYVTSDDDAQTS